MATIAGALATGALTEFRLPEHEGRSPVRPLYVATELFDWIDETDELYVKDWSDSPGGRSIAEHLSQTFCDFRCDLRPLVGDLNRVTPTAKGVWKIHSPGLRIFGWVPDEYGFVAVISAFNSSVHGPNSKVGEAVSGVISFAKSHGLHETFKRGDRRAFFQAAT